MPMPVLAVRARPPRAREQPGQRVGDDLRPARPTRRCGTPPAGRCRWRTATGPSVERRSGIQTTPTTTTSTTSARGTHSLHDRAADQAREPVRRAAAGRVQHEQRRAGPHERHRQRDDDVGHAGDHDERAVDRRRGRGPAAARRGRRRREPLALVLHQDGRRDAGEGHDRADRQVDAAGDDDDRLGDRGERDRQRADRQALDLGAP